MFTWDSEFWCKTMFVFVMMWIGLFHIVVSITTMCYYFLSLQNTLTLSLKIYHSWLYGNANKHTVFARCKLSIQDICNDFAIYVTWSPGKTKTWVFCSFYWIVFCIDGVVQNIWYSMWWCYFSSHATVFAVSV